MCDEELIYDYASFSSICKECTLLEQISVAFPSVSVIRSKNDSFVNFENCLGDLPQLATLNITTWPTNSPSSTKLPRKIYEHLLAGLAQQGFERSASNAKEKSRSSKLGIIAFGSSDKVYDREDSENQISTYSPVFSPRSPFPQPHNMTLANLSQSFSLCQRPPNRSPRQ
jgi:hypothetical protein